MAWDKEAHRLAVYKYAKKKKEETGKWPGGHGSPEQYRKWRSEHIAQAILPSTKSRCKKFNIPFNITVDDIIVPEFCPITGLKLSVGGKRNDSTASLDRLVPELGYVKGNVRLISWRANRIKSDATLEELEKMVAYMKGNI